MKIYVAGSMYHPGIDHVRRVQDALRMCGHTITYDWTSQIAVTDKGRQALAESEMWGVLSADLLVLIDHDRPRGALIETGAALGAGKEVYVLLEDEGHLSIFYELPNCTIIASWRDLDRAIRMLPNEPGEYD